MRKLRLRLDELEIASFDTTEAPEGAGTVVGQEAWTEDPTCQYTCQVTFCSDETCGFCTGPHQTCYHTCGCPYSVQDTCDC
ncbi:MAG TPA: hypothetical protein VNP72_05035 [Longimicrobium sp.]|nr:hypothetical protein [Longimicrobium sp.]